MAGTIYWNHLLENVYSWTCLETFWLCLLLLGIKIILLFLTDSETHFVELLNAFSKNKGNTGQIGRSQETSLEGLSLHPQHERNKRHMVTWLRRAIHRPTSISVIVKHPIFYLLTSLISHLFPYGISSVSSFMTCGSVILLFVFKCLIFYYHMLQEYTLLSAPPGHLFLSMCLVCDRLFLPLGRDLSFQHAFHLWHFLGHLYLIFLFSGPRIFIVHVVLNFCLWTKKSLHVILLL